MDFLKIGSYTEIYFIKKLNYIMPIRIVFKLILWNFLSEDLLLS